MLAVSISVNGREIVRVACHRVAGPDLQGMCIYETDDRPEEVPFQHRYDDGAVELARKLLVQELKMR